MKTKLSLQLAATLLLLSTLLPPFATAHAQTSAFTFQGQLASGAGNANGSYDLRFAVWDANVAGNFIAGTVTNTAVAVSNGLFTVALDFGPGVFTGTNYWVEMGVRTNGGGSFATLVPRQPLTPTPYALYAPQAGSATALSGSSPQINSLCPPGAVIAFAGASAPTGWLLCNGSSLATASYPALFAAIGYTYGGSGSQFSLPDMRGRTGIGAGQGSGLSNRALGQKIGEETHTLTIPEMPNHAHGVNDPGHSHAQYVSANNGGSAIRNDYQTDLNGQPYPQGINTGVSTTGISIQSTGGGAAHNIMQPSLVLNYIIKY